MTDGRIRLLPPSEPDEVALPFPDLPVEARVLELGPMHPALATPIGLRLSLSGERIVDVEVRPGAGHRGVEKECEAGSWYQAIPYVERLNDVCGIAPSVGFCLGVERMLDVELPERGQWLRVLACELARVVEHWTRLAAVADALEAGTARFVALDARELAWARIEALCGARVTPHYPRIGGVRHDAPDGFERSLRSVVAELRIRLLDYERATLRLPIFVERLRDVAPLPAARCLAFGITGPLLRAAGVAMDLRKDAPYLTYDELDFDVPTGSVGDHFDRLLVVLEELRQSLRILEQGAERLAGLAGAPVDVDDPRVRWPARDAVFQRMEGMIHHFQGVIAGPRVPAGESYGATESANGELGFLLVSDGGERPVRLRCRPPSFFHAQALPELLRGAWLGDVMPTLALVHLQGGECDR